MIVTKKFEMDLTEYDSLNDDVRNEWFDINEVKQVICDVYNQVMDDSKTIDTLDWNSDLVENISDDLIFYGPEPIQVEVEVDVDIDKLREKYKE